MANNESLGDVVWIIAVLTRGAALDVEEMPATSAFRLGKVTSAVLGRKVNVLYWQRRGTPGWVIDICISKQKFMFETLSSAGNRLGPFNT